MAYAFFVKDSFYSVQMCTLPAPNDPRPSHVLYHTLERVSSSLSHTHTHTHTHTHCKYVHVPNVITPCSTVVMLQWITTVVCLSIKTTFQEGGLSFRSSINNLDKCSFLHGYP